MAIINLRHLNKNQSGTIAAIRTNGELGRRIRDMGLVPGTKITVQGRAPLKGPGGPPPHGIYPDTFETAKPIFIDVEVP